MNCKEVRVLKPLTLASRRRIADRWAPIMFTVSMLYLAALAALIVITVDAAAFERDQAIPYPETYRFLFTFLFVSWLLFWGEMFFYWIVRPWSGHYRGYQLRGLLCALCPPLRMCVRNPDLAGRIWYPALGWRRVDDRLRMQLSRGFSIPMLIIAVLILPVLGTEYFLKDQVIRYPALQATLLLGTGSIWFAFTLEFIFMMSVAESRLEYCKRHWIDLLIILLPLISFLRTLQLLRATRLAQIAMIPQMTTMVRVYRLRGLSTKALRALVLLDLATRIFRLSPERRILRLHREYLRLTRELRDIEQRLELIHQQHPHLRSTLSHSQRTPASSTSPKVNSSAK